MKPRTSADIVAIDDTLEALAVRSVLEWWGAQVTFALRASFGRGSNRYQSTGS